jgi:hypothetical protein
LILIYKFESSAHSLTASPATTFGKSKRRNNKGLETDTCATPQDIMELAESNPLTDVYCFMVIFYGFLTRPQHNKAFGRL